MYLLTEWESRTGKYFEWLSFKNFENFGLTYIGRNRLTCMAKPQRRIDTKNSSFIFSSQNKKLTIIRKNVTHFFISVHYCHSLIVTTAKKCFSFIYLFSFLATKLHKCTLAGRLLTDRFTSTLPTSAFQWFSVELREWGWTGHMMTAVI